MVNFGRDMQKSAEISAKILQAEFCSDSVLQCSCRRYTRRALQHFRFHFCIQRCAEISVEVLHSEFCRVLQKSILRSSAEKPSEGKLCGVFAIILQRFPLDSCIRIYTRRILQIMLWCFCLSSFGETLTKTLHHNYAEVSDEILQADFADILPKSTCRIRWRSWTNFSMRISGELSVKLSMQPMHIVAWFLSDHISAKFLHAEFSRVEILGQSFCQFTIDSCGMEDSVVFPLGPLYVCYLYDLLYCRGPASNRMAQNVIEFCTAQWLAAFCWRPLVAGTTRDLIKRFKKKCRGPASLWGPSSFAIFMAC